jgi:predicted phage tail protein
MGDLKDWLLDKPIDMVREGIRTLDPVGGPLQEWTEQFAADNPWVVQVAGAAAGWFTFGAGAVAVAYIADRYVKPRVAKPGLPNKPGGSAPSVSVGGFGGFGGGGGGGGFGDGYNVSQAYSFNPKTTQMQGTTIPEVAGLFRVHGNLISSYTEFINDKTYIYILISAGMGPIADIREILINNQPYAIFSGVTTDGRTGLIDQLPIRGFNDTKVEYSSSVKVLHSDAYEYQTPGDSFDALEVMIAFPRGLGYMGDDGELEALSVEFIVAAVNLSGGAPFNLFAGTISDAKTAAITRTCRADNLSPGRHEIQITRVTEDHTTSRYMSDLYFVGVREVHYDDFEYPREALLAVKTVATEYLSGDLDVSFLCQGKRCWVNAAGEWEFKWTDSPPWIAWNVLTQPVTKDNWPAGRVPYAQYLAACHRFDGRHPDTLISDDFNAWAEFCDTLVPDGKGGTEKRFTFNGVFDTIQSLWDQFLSICSTYRAVPVIRGFKIGLYVEKAEAGPYPLVSEGNIVAGTFKESFAPLETLANEYEVSFVNAENDYKQETFNVLDYDTLEAPRKNSVNLIGITKYSEAWRYAAAQIARNKNCIRVVEFGMEVDAISFTVGQVFNFQSSLPPWGVGGRIVSATSGSVTLDKTVTIEAGKAYSVTVRPQGSEVGATKTVTNAAGAHTVLTISGTWDVTPSKYDVYSFGETAIHVKPFRCLEIKHRSEFSYTITGLEYNGTIFNGDTGTPVIPTPQYSSFDPYPPVTNIVLDELVIKGQDGALLDVIDVYFDRPAAAAFDHAEIWYRKGDAAAPWLFSGKTWINKWRIPNIIVSQTYTVAVVTVNAGGKKNSPAASPQASVYTLGLLDPPTNVTNFRGSQNGRVVTFSWDHIEDADLWGYEIRIGPYSWESANKVIKLQSGDRQDVPVEFDGTYRYWIKAIDTSGIYSTTAAHVDLTITGTESDLNFLVDAEKVTENSPSAPDGTLVGYEWDSGEDALVFTPTDTDDPPTDFVCSFETEDIQAADVPRLGTIRLLATIDSTTPLATNRTYPTRTNRTYPGDTNQHVTSVVAQAMEYAYSDTSPATEFHPYTTPITASFKFFRARHTVTVDSYDSEVILEALRCSVDLPGVKYSIKDLAVAATTGTDVSFSTYGLDFYAAPNIQVTVSYGSGAASAVSMVPVISEIDADGFHVDLVDIAGAKRAGTVNVQLEGY